MISTNEKLVENKLINQLIWGICAHIWNSHSHPTPKVAETASIFKFDFIKYRLSHNLTTLFITVTQKTTEKMCAESRQITYLKIFIEWSRPINSNSTNCQVLPMDVKISNKCKNDLLVPTTHQISLLLLPLLLSLTWRLIVKKIIIKW